MTAKEKALELWTTYRFILSIKNAPLGQQKDLIAKQCALIAVDEIVKALTTSTGHLVINKIDENELVKDFNYWNEVKNEIEKL